MTSSNGDSVHSVTDLSHGQDWSKSSLEQWLANFLDRAQVRQIGADLQRWASEHPLVAAGSVTMLTLSIFPVLVFLAFAAFCTTVAAIGFLMFEGFMMLLGCWLLLTTLTSIAIGTVCTLSVVGAAWYSFSGSYRLLHHIVDVIIDATKNTKKKEY